MSPKLIDTENMVSISGILVAALDIRHLGTPGGADSGRGRCAGWGEAQGGKGGGWCSAQSAQCRSGSIAKTASEGPSIWLCQYVAYEFSRYSVIFCHILYDFLKISNVRYAASCQRCSDDGPRRWPARWRRRCPTPAIASSAKWSRSWRTWSEGTAQASTDGTENHHILVVYIYNVW